MTNTNEKKAKSLTKLEKLAMLKPLVSASDHEKKAELLEFIDKEMALLEKKKEKAKTENPEIAVIADTIIEVLAENARAMTIGELMKDDRLKTYTKGTGDKAETVDMTNQKMNSVLIKLKAADRVVRTENKKVAYFSLA